MGCEPRTSTMRHRRHGCRPAQRASLGPSSLASLPAAPVHFRSASAVAASHWYCNATRRAQPLTYCITHVMMPRRPAQPAVPDLPWIMPEPSLWLWIYFPPTSGIAELLLVSTRHARGPVASPVPELLRARPAEISSPCRAVHAKSSTRLEVKTID